MYQSDWIDLVDPKKIRYSNTYQSRLKDYGFNDDPTEETLFFPWYDTSHQKEKYVNMD
jgi:hypothetical protein